jgi:2-keto-3-deoxy-L-rhamnonate aldolase RhmA
MAGRLKDVLKQGKLAKVFCLGQLCHPKLVELIGLVGAHDGIWLDQEHAGLSIAQIEDATRAGRAIGIDCFVSLTATDYSAVMRPLEAGACGIMAAQVRSAEEAAQIVRWAKFHPRGLRGFNGGGIDGLYGGITPLEYTAQANASTLVVIQIEHEDAVRDVERIAAVPDIDVLFIGPADLSQSMGILGQWEHPRLWEAIERVAKAAKAHGTLWGILPLGPTAARRCVELGCKMLSLDIDVLAFRRGMQTFCKDWAEFF